MWARITGHFNSATPGQSFRVWQISHPIPIRTPDPLRSPTLSSASWHPAYSCVPEMSVYSECIGLSGLQVHITLVTLSKHLPYNLFSTPTFHCCKLRSSFFLHVPLFNRLFLKRLPVLQMMAEMFPTRGAGAVRWPGDGGIMNLVSLIHTGGTKTGACNELMLSEHLKWEQR